MRKTVEAKDYTIDESATLTLDRLDTRMVLLGEGWEVEADSLKPSYTRASFIR